MSKCLICNSKKNYCFTEKVLIKYDVNYFQCVNCGLLQTDKPYWLEEAYNLAITNLDIGLLSRADECVLNTTLVINNLIENGLFDNTMQLIDFAGGYGVFVRKMRDLGFNTFWQDDFCENIFAKSFEYNEAVKYNMLTAFEVLEHVYNPVELFQRLKKHSDVYLFSTQLIDNISNMQNWWYLSPTTGQHITFYTRKSLEIIADRCQMRYYCLGNFHLFIPLQFNDFNFEPLKLEEPSYFKIIRKFIKLFKLPVDIQLSVIKPQQKSLLQVDFNYLVGIQKKE